MMIGYDYDMSLNRASSLPLHHQIRSEVEASIMAGRYGPGDQLPTDGEYATQFGVSVAPVRQALLGLAAAGRVERKKGKGTFVKAPRIQEPILLVGSFTEGLRRRGLPFEIRVLNQDRIRADPDVAAALKIGGRESVVLLRRLVSIHNEPAAILEAFLPASRFPGLANLGGFEDGRSLYQTLSETYGVKLWFTQTVFEVAACNHEQSELLRVQIGAPALRVESVTQDGQHEPVELSRLLFRSDRYTFTTETKSITNRG
jgi:GntR family transcriptional regulator